MHHKTLHALAERDQLHRLDGQIQLDDAYLGCERSDASTGRDTTDKTPFVAAVSVNAAGHPLFLKLSPVQAFSYEATALWVRSNLAPSVTDLATLPASRPLRPAYPVVAGSAKPAALPDFHWINTVLRNLKRSFAGAHHSSKFGKYADAYLAGFAYRFNRCFDLKGLVARLIVDVAPRRAENMQGH
ncbi:hypothetical protein IWX58_003464 [Rubrivivax gelatinosus]|nr:transposase [Rubrivivax gelatinosus]MBG6081777.1 hypothetical protein [Rubrivivax gelatinosus]